jgi:hypothetical protein
MPDTGAPWNIPYVDPTDLVRDYPAASEDLAEAIADGLTAAGGLVAVKSALFTGTQTASVTASSNVAVTNLSITHTLADAANKLIISAFIGVGGSSVGIGNIGIGIADDGTLIGVGDAAGSRVPVASGGDARVTGTATSLVVSLPVTFVYAPGDVSEHTYTVRAINIRGSTETLFINRSQSDADSANQSRGSSGFVIQEVKV